MSAIVFGGAAPLRAEDRVAAGTPHLHLDDELGLSIAVRVENGNHRSFRQFEPTTGELRTYDARVYGGVGVSLGYERPLADTSLSWRLFADYWHSLFFTSGARRLGRTVETTAQRLSGFAGLALHPWGLSDGAAFEVIAGAGAMGFDYAMPGPRSDDDRSMELATGNYTYASAGLGARVPLSPVTLSVRGDFLFGLHTGSFGARHAQDQPRGFDAFAAVELGVLSWLDLALVSSLTVLWLRLAPLPARPDDDAAEVSDLYLTLGLAAKAHY